MFRNKYERKVQTSEPGSGIRQVYAAEYDKQKNLKVVPKGKENLYAYINSFADSVNLHLLLARFQNGDKEALLQRAGAYIDISALPTNINEFIELSRNATNLFNTLPVEVKEKFNNNVVEFVSTIGDPDWNEKMSVSPADVKKDIVDTSKKALKKHKDAAKVQFNNSVYGDQPTIEDFPENPTVNVNPLTGNEVN